LENLESRDHLGDIGVNEEITWKWILVKEGVSVDIIDLPEDSKK
jgi:hypothetical protein